MRYFGYKLEKDSITAGADVEDTISIDSDSDFECMSISASFADVSLNDLAGWCGLNIKDSTSGSEWWSGKVRLDLLIDSQKRPFVLPQPVPIKGGATVTVKVKNNHASTTCYFKICLHGIKVPRGR